MGFGEIRPFEVSTEFEMGMYPPGTFPGQAGDNFNNEQLIPHHGHRKNAPELTIHSSPLKTEIQGGQHPSKNLKNGNRNI